MQHICVQQRPNGPHGDGPVENSAAGNHAAANQDFFFLETHSNKVLVLIGLFKYVLGELLDLVVHPESPTYGLCALQTCKKKKKKAKPVLL